MKLLAFIVLLAAGCSHNFPDQTFALTADDHARVVALVDVWNETEGVPPIDAACAGRLARDFRFAVVGDEPLWEECGLCPPGNCPGFRASNRCPMACAGECARWIRFGTFGSGLLFGRKTPIVMVHETRAAQGKLLELVHHGLVHLVGDSRCAGAEYGDDALHRHQGRWGQEGIEGRAWARIVEQGLGP